ncbi:hypothetical protein GUJ93_ZPchr0009g2225 [Zizania palustris]|uniref:Uncharacterized protein n=1 Tax=Zizania palustris TaxID=103762 RepID=A0A8J5R807_ZIZPA|nr:hypothetical protein GUJ93_ZPchr0009g2225 [Zizania palustris]
MNQPPCAAASESESDFIVIRESSRSSSSCSWKRSSERVAGVRLPALVVAWMKGHLSSGQPEMCKILTDCLVGIKEATSS